MNLLCPHGDRDWRCPTCCLMDLRRDLPRLHRAVREAEKGSGAGRSTFGSRVPTGFGTAALALLQDINKADPLPCRGRVRTLHSRPPRPPRQPAREPGLRQGRCHPLPTVGRSRVDVAGRRLAPARCPAGRCRMTQDPEFAKGAYQSGSEPVRLAGGR